MDNVATQTTRKPFIPAGVFLGPNIPIESAEALIDLELDADETYYLSRMEREIMETPCPRR